MVNGKIIHLMEKVNYISRMDHIFMEHLHMDSYMDKEDIYIVEEAIMKDK